jgi:protein SCO1
MNVGGPEMTPHTPQRSGRPGGAGAALVVLMVVALAGPVAAHDPPAARAPSASPLSAAPHLAVIKPAPDFALPDLDGRLVRLADLRGRITLVSFVYTRCATACPLLTARLALLQRRAAALPPAERPVLVSITVDPERDTPERLRRYAEQFGVDRSSWRFLRDEPARLTPVLHAWDEWTRPVGDGDLDHPARVYLLDRAGRVREIYALEFFDPRQAWLDVRALLRER